MASRVEIGSRYGRLVVLRIEPGRATLGRQAICKCDCGGEKSVPVRHLALGRFTSCGCANAPTLYVIDGAPKTIVQLRAMCPLPGGISARTLRDRLRRGWDPRRAITEPPGPPVPKKGTHVAR